MHLKELIDTSGNDSLRSELNDLVKQGFRFIALDDRDNMWFFYRSKPVYMSSVGMWRESTKPLRPYHSTPINSFLRLLNDEVRLPSIMGVVTELSSTKRLRDITEIPL